MYDTPVFLLNTGNRFLNLYTCSVANYGDGVILRFGAEVGNIWDFSRSRLAEASNRRPEKGQLIPWLILTRGYEARQSAGFVGVNVVGNNHINVKIKGMIGMPFMVKKGLLLLKEPWDAVLLHPKTDVSLIKTHNNSNTATCWAACSALNTRAELRKDDLIVTEGQSDYIKAISFKRSSVQWSTVVPSNLGGDVWDSEKNVQWPPEWPEEHIKIRTQDGSD